jgi:hypothetical protein
MTRLNELDVSEMEDVARIVDPNYTPEKFEADMAEFVQIKKSVLRHRAKLLKRSANKKILH